MRVATLLGKGLLMLLLGLLAAELALQVGSLFVRGREHDAATTAAVRILCVGDSHTYGAPLTEPESYPAQLQTFLDRRAPGRYAVVNAGVPGTNTAQWRHRLPLLVEKYQPQIVVLWMGVNDLWNGADFDAAADTWSEWADAIAARSRLYRLLRVWRHDQAIDTARLKRGGRLEVSVEHPNDGALWTVRHEDGTIETIQNEKLQWKQSDATTKRAAADFAAMVDHLRARGIAAVFISYPRHTQFFEPANRAIRSITAEEKVPLVDGTAAAERVPEPERVYLFADHPSAPIYREIARDVAAVIP